MPPGTGFAQTARIENFNKIPGTNRGFPAEDYFTFHRSERARNSQGVDLKFSDSHRFRIYNDGSSNLNIRRLTTTNTANFTVTGVSIPSGGLNVAPGKFVEGKINFVTNYGETRRLITDYLVMESNARNASSFRPTLTGAYMTGVEGGAEINVQQIFEAFGFKTRMGVDNNGNLQTRPSSVPPTASKVNAGLEGDFILSANFVAADPSKPVNLIQMAAFHGPGGAPTEFRDPVKANVVGDIRYSHSIRNHQTLLPRMETSDDNAGDFAPKITEAWEIMVGGYRTSGGNRANEFKDRILGTRVYKVVDRNGDVVPNEYIIIMDYVENGCGAGSANCDWNDNVSYLVNARPQNKPSAGKLSDVTASAGKAKTFGTASAFDLGYPGNKLAYSVSLDKGGSLPNWISIDKKSGEVRVDAPGNTAKQQIKLRITATDLNGLRVSSDLTLSIDGSTVAPPPPPSPEPEPPVTGVYWLEAECATVGKRWTTVKSGAAAGGEYVVVQGNSSTNSAATDEDSRVRFTLTDVEAGSYQLFARIDAADPLSDSYWVRINGSSWFNWNSGFEVGKGFQWNDYPDKQIRLNEGTNTIDFAFREDGTRLDKIALSGKPIPTNSGVGGEASNCNATTPPTGEGDATVEAECGTVGSGWTLFADRNASNGTYATFINGERRIDKPTSDEPAQQLKFDVSVDGAGTYNLFVRLNAPDPGRNSVWIKIDNGDWIKFWEEVGGAQLLTNGFEWRRANDDGKNVSFNLSNGNHTIRMANRETGTEIDKVSLLQSSTVPTGFGPDGRGCRPAALATSFNPGVSAALDIEVEPKVSLFPNPVGANLNVALESDHKGRVDIVLTDLRGRRVRSLQFDKQSERLSIELEVGDLAAGMYYVRIVEGDRLTVRPVVKQ